MATASITKPALSFGHAIVDKVYTVVDGSLQIAADGAESINHAIRPAPKLLDSENEIDGLYHSPVARLIEGLRDQIKRGLPFTLNLQNVAAILDVLVVADFKGGMNDREYLLEYVLTFLSRLPPGPLADKLQVAVISLLWNDLAHPPASLVGSEYQYRTYDGFRTSIWRPDMGKAGSPYARSVQTKHSFPANALPSPELLFDTLLKREKPEIHPAGLSSTFFAFANLVIHSLFWTDHSHPKQPVNLVSSYLDLSPLYGIDQAANAKIRLFDGTGGLKPDTFADPRLLGMPPSTGALLVLFNRNHNYIVKKLFEINERGSWHDTNSLSEEDLKRQDEELFQTARLVNSGWFMSIILGDYLAAILGLVREGSNWSLDPLSEFRGADHAMVERGTGNVVSVEFLALYHFHSSISVMDEQWAEDAFKQIFPGQGWDDITIKDYQEKLPAFLKRFEGIDPDKWPIGTLKRGPDGSFDSAQLAAILQKATLEPASAFKARGTPHVLRIVELVAIEQNRAWGTCSLNEFRKFLGLKPYSSFEEWNPRPDVAEAARRLYGTPDNLELYVGLQAEEAKKPRPGAGLCPGFTMSRAILADAVALVRGDRFLTNDLTTYNLTSWGYNDAARNPNNSSNGGVLSRLLLRTLGDYYPYDSTYTNFPFITPKAMKGFLESVGTAKLYTFDPPQYERPVKPLKSYREVEQALSSPIYVSSIPANAAIVLPGKGYFGTYNEPGQHVANTLLISKAFLPSSSKHHAEYFRSITELLIKERSYTLVGDNKRSVNIVRDVINILPVYFVSDQILGLPLKTTARPHGSVLDQELYLKLKEIYDFILTNDDPSTKVYQEADVKRYVYELVEAAEAHIIGIATGSLPIIGLVESAYLWLTKHPLAAHAWLARLVAAGRGKSRRELANDAVALGVLSSVELSQAITHVVDSLLLPETVPQSSDPNSPPFPTSLDGVIKLAKSSVPSDEALLRELITYILRIHPAIPGTYRTLVSDAYTPKDSKTAGPPLKKGDRVYLSFTEAGNDPTVWDGVKPRDPNPPVPEPLIAGGLVKLLGPTWLVDVITPVIKVVFSLRSIKRAPGNSGKLLSFVEDVEGTKVKTYLNYKQQPTIWSSDLTITYSL